MKDPSKAIYDAFHTALNGNLKYDSKNVHIIRSRAEVKKRNYVLLDYLESNDDITGDSFDSECTLRIEIRVGPYMQQGYNDILFDISSSLLQLIIKKELTISGFSWDVTPFLSFMRNYEERIDNEGIYKIKELLIKFNVSED